MKGSKVLGLLVSLVVVGAVGYMSMGVANAQGYEFRSPLIQRLVERFNLDQTEVDKVVEEVRAERQEEMSRRIEDRLSTAVENGNLTSEQKDKILAKLDELKSRKADLSDLTPEERRQQMEEHHQELEDWANENGIDIKYVMRFGFGHGPRQWKNN